MVLSGALGLGIYEAARRYISSSEVRMIQTVEVSKTEGDVDMASIVPPSLPFSESELEEKEVYTDGDIRVSTEKTVVPWMTASRKRTVNVKSSDHVYLRLYAGASFAKEDYRIERGDRIDVIYYTHDTVRQLEDRQRFEFAYSHSYSDYDLSQNAIHAARANVDRVLWRLKSLNPIYGLQFLCFTQTGAAFIRL